LQVARLEGASKDEESLRLARYLLLGNFAREQSAKAICTGHTLDDQTETVLFRLFRGTSPAGLCGIADWSEKTAAGVPVMRPLLSIRRAAVSEFLERNRLPSRVDSSNQ